MGELLRQLPSFLGGHLRISLAALVVGVGLSIPLGLVASRVRAVERPALALAGIVQTVPSLAMLAAMVPLLAALGLPSIGTLPAFLGLVLYSALPVLQNTVIGIQGVDANYIEAARGLGMTDRQRMRRVELPLALPVILAGVRTATVWTVGAATLSTPVGATSLGNYIFAGLQTRNHASVLLGCVAAAGLALVLDGFVRWISACLARRKTTPVAVALAGFLGLAFLSWVPSGSWGRGGLAPIVIGAKTFTEQYILAALLSEQIERTTGDHTEVRSSLGSTVAFDALRAGDIDVYVDYSGTLWATVVKQEPPKDRASALAALATHLDALGVTLVAPLGFENTYVLAMKASRARELGVVTIGDLTPHAGGLSIGGDFEFFARPEWQSVRSTYGLAFREERTMDPSLLYEAVAHDEVDVISGYSTEGRIAAYDLATLVDDRGAIPPYDAVVLARKSLGTERPDVVAALAQLADSIDATRMRQSNQAVDRDGKSPAEVAVGLSAPSPVVPQEAP